MDATLSESSHSSHDEDVCKAQIKESTGDQNVQNVESKNTSQRQPTPRK